MPLIRIQTDDNRVIAALDRIRDALQDADADLAPPSNEPKPDDKPSP